MVRLPADIVKKTWPPYMATLQGDIILELTIHFSKLPEGMELDDVRQGLDNVLEDDGWLIGLRQGCIEVELEDEKVNPKHGIVAVKRYLQCAAFAPDTTIELAGVPVGIYE